jgi:hypothetical protein
MRNHYINGRARKIGVATLALAAVCWPNLASAQYASKATESIVIAPNSTSALFAIPARNVPILVMAVQTVAGAVGVGSATLISSTHEQDVKWVATDYFTATVSIGASLGGGTHVFYVDPGHCVDVEVADLTHLQIRNVCNTQYHVNLTLIW